MNLADAILTPETFESLIVDLVGKHGRCDYCFRKGQPWDFDDDFLRALARKHNLRVTIYHQQPTCRPDLLPGVVLDEVRFTRNPPENDCQAHAHLGIY